jgi:hypothetical protein
MAALDILPLFPHLDFCQRRRVLILTMLSYEPLVFKAAIHMILSRVNYTAWQHVFPGIAHLFLAI